MDYSLGEKMSILFPFEYKTTMEHKLMASNIHKSAPFTIPVREGVVDSAEFSVTLSISNA